MTKKGNLIMVNNVETKQKNVRPSDIIEAQIMQMAVLGTKKAEIAKEFGMSVSNVNRVIYSQNGQATMKSALENIQNEIAHKLPSIIESALSELGVPILTGRKRTLRNLNFHKRLISFNNL